MMNRLCRGYRRITSEITEIPEIFRQKKFPSLDGFRAVSIMIVLGFHMGRTENAFYNIIFNGSLGVNIFFVISGFLITTLLVKENVITGTISLKKFYVRRILRIFPVAYLYLLVIVALNYFFKLHISPLYLTAAFLYGINFKFFDPYKSSLVSHYWSLAVEEQFYIIFPFILKKSFRGFLFLLLFIVLILPVLISLELRIPAMASMPVFVVTHYLIKFQSIAVGCLFSIFMFKKFIPFNINRRWQLVCKMMCIFLIFLLRHTGSVDAYSVYSNLLISGLTAFLITLNLSASADWIYRFLNFPWVAKAGVLSYSIYVWHLLFLNTEIFPVWITHSPAALFLSLAAAALSYQYWEKYFLKFKKRVPAVSAVTPANQPGTVF